jgi:uncharacterized membrane protein (TIGR02234 family)
MRSRLGFLLALALQLVGSVGILLAATRTWQTVVTPRPRPFADAVLPVSGRTLDAAPTALALVALAGIVAVLATRGWPRRIVGAIVVLAGAAAIWRIAVALPAVDADRARDLVRAHQSRVSLSAQVMPTVSAHPVWGVLSIAAAVLVIASGLLAFAFGGAWRSMSARYDAPSARSAVDESQERQKADARLWSALDRGEDPTRAE